MHIPFHVLSISIRGYNSIIPEFLLIHNDTNYYCKLYIKLLYKIERLNIAYISISDDFSWLDNLLYVL